MNYRNGSLDTMDADLKDQLSEIWSIIRRRYKLVLFGLLLSSMLGTLYYLKVPRTYESMAEIFIETKPVTTFRNQVVDDKDKNAKTIETHALFVASPLIVAKAVSEHDLSGLASLQDEEYTPAEIILENMEVEILEEEATVLAIRYPGTNAEDCHKIVAGITRAYEDFLGQSREDLGRETTKLISRAKGELLDRLAEKEARYVEFQKNAPPELMWKDGEGVNMHRERQLEIETERRQLEIELSVLSAKIVAIKDALREGGTKRDAVYFEAVQELRPDDGLDYQRVQVAEQERYAEREAVREYAATLTREYVSLLVQERKLREDFASGHPDLKAVQSQIAETKTLLRRTMDANATKESVNSERPDKTNTSYVETYMQSLKDKLLRLQRQIASLDEMFVKEQELANAMQVHLLQDQQFRLDVARTEQLFDAVVARLDEINIVRDGAGERMNVLAEAKLGEQIAPDALIVAIAATFLGLLGGCCLAWLVDQAENTFRSAEEIRQVMKAPVIGRIPLIKRKQQSALAHHPDVSPMVFTLHQSSSHLAEAYRAVRTALYFSNSGESNKVIQITSPMPGDGKSTVAANLAVAMARSGKKVLLLDADFRRPTIHKLLGVHKNVTHGLASAVQGLVEPLEAVIESSVDNLSFVPTGQTPSNPSELLSSVQFKSLIEFYRERFDFILIDTPPLLAVSDPSAVAARVDGVLITLRIRKGVQVATERAREMLANIDANVLGVIVNAVDHTGNYGKHGYGYGYGYGYEYGNSNYGDTMGDGKSREVGVREERTQAKA